MVLGNLFRRVFIDFAYGTITLYGPTFQKDSAIEKFCNSLENPEVLPKRPHDPSHTRFPALTYGLV